MRLLLVIWAFLMCIGCFLPAYYTPNVCGTNTEPSVLCDLATAHDVELEKVGALLVVLNAVAIADGRYTSGDAVKVLRELKMFIDTPISYRFLRLQLRRATADYPGLFGVAELYLDELNSPLIISNFDRRVLGGWINDRIKGLESGM